jgi:hypothetical protein
MDSSTNILKRVVFLILPDFNFTTIEETVVLSILIIEKDEMAISIINVE